MLFAATLFVLTFEMWTAAQIRALGETDDARLAPRIESALAHRLDQAKRFPRELLPSELEGEIVESLLALERLEPASARRFSHEILDDPASARLLWTARSVSARSGDPGVVHTALDQYFRAPSRFRRVLGDAALATGDVRLRDFLPYGDPPEPASETLSRTRLLSARGETADAESLPRTPFPDTLFSEDTLSIQTDVLSFEPPVRALALRWLAERDHPALVGIPLSALDVSRLAPYLATSHRPVLRERVRRAGSSRGRALASILLSPVASDLEKADDARAMRDAWAEAIRAGGERVYETLLGVVGAKAVLDFIADAGPLKPDVPGTIPLDAARVADESLLARWGSLPIPAPDAFAAMYQFHRRYTGRFGPWLTSENESLRERARLVLASSHDADRLPLLVDLAAFPRSAVSRDAAFRGLAEQELLSYARRLHRLAGDPDRTVRFAVAAALVPAGEAWTLRLLLAEVNVDDPRECLRVRQALERLGADRARKRLEAMVWDGTASPFAVELFLDLEPDRVRGSSALRDRLGQVLKPHVVAGDERALLAAARLSHREASASAARLLGWR